MTIDREPIGVSKVSFGRRRRAILGLMFGAVFWTGTRAGAKPLAPELLITNLSARVMDAIRADPDIRAGDIGRVRALVDAEIMPHVDARRMTSSALGRYWRRASPAQRPRLQEEFTALAQVTDQTIRVKPLHSVRSLGRRSCEPRCTVADLRCS